MRGISGQLELVYNSDMYVRISQYLLHYHTSHTVAHIKVEIQTCRLSSLDQP